MTYKTLGGGLDLSLSMESKSNSLPLMMSAGGVSEGSSRDSGGASSASRGKRRQKTANIAIWREKSRFCGGKTLRCYFRIYGGDFL